MFLRKGEKMKKCITLFLSLMLAFSLTACGSGEKETTTAAESTTTEAATTTEAESTAAETTAVSGGSGLENPPVGVDQEALDLFNAASLKTGELTNTRSRIQMDMVMGEGAEQQRIAMDLEMTLIKSGEEGEMACSGSMETMGVNMVLSTFYKDGYLYTEAIGEKVKQATDFASAVGSIDMTSSIVSEVEPDKFTAIGMEVLADGNTKITFIANTGDTEGLNECYGTMTVSPEGYAVAQSYTMSGFQTQDGVSQPLSVMVSLETLAYGDDVQIDYPDFSDYQES